MANPPENPYEAYTASSLSSDGLRKFSDILTGLKGKIVELYIGDQYESLSFVDNTQSINGIIYGRIIEVLDRFVMIDCFYVEEGSNEVRSGNTIYINTFQIRAFTELNHQGSLGDIFLSTKHANKIKKLLHKR